MPTALKRRKCAANRRATALLDDASAGMNSTFVRLLSQVCVCAIVVCVFECMCVRERHRMVPISADDFPREPAEQSYRARVSSAGTVCTVLNNVPKTREAVKENSLLQFNNIEKEWMESCIINPVLQK